MVVVLLALRNIFLGVGIFAAAICGAAYNPPMPDPRCNSTHGDDLVSPRCQNIMPFPFFAHAFTASWRQAVLELVCGDFSNGTIPLRFFCIASIVADDILEFIEAFSVLLVRALVDVPARAMDMHLPWPLDPRAVREFYARLSHLPRACVAGNNTLTQAFLVKRGTHDWPYLMHLGALERTGWIVHATWTGDIWVEEGGVTTALV